MMTLNKCSASALALVVIFSGCGKSSTATSSVNVHMRNTSMSPGTPSSLRSLSDLLSQGGSRADLSGYSSASQLLSLKYIFGQIAICESTDATSAFGFTSESGCTSIYSGRDIGMTDPATSVDTILAAYNQPTDAFDLMSSTDIARLNASTAAANVGTYKYVLVNWASAIGVQGSVTAGTGGAAVTLNTKTQTSYSTGSNGFPISHTTASLVGGTPEMTYVKSANGGTVFKFQQPQTIVAGTDYQLDLIFNPSGVLNGCADNGVSGNISDGSHSITMPMLPVSAVLRASTDTLMRESYVITASVSASYQVDLYYLASDASKNVIGAQITGLVNGTSADCFAPDNRVFTVTTAADGSVSLEANADGSQTLLTGLVRGSAGNSTNVTFGSFFNGLPLGVTVGARGSATVTALN